MKLGISVFFLLERFGLERAISLVKEAGFDFVDFNFEFLAEDPEFIADHRGYAKRIKAVLEKNDIVAEQAHAYYYMGIDNKFDESDEVFSVLVKSIEAAAMVGAKHIVFHSVTIPRSEKQIDFTEFNYAFFKSLEPYCEKFKIKIAIENNYVHDDKCGCYRSKLGSPNELSEFIKRLDSPWFAACIDVGHAALVGIEPQDFIRGMDKGLIETVHMHDVNYKRDCHVIPFCEKLDWAEIISALRDVGYKGNFDLECGLSHSSIPEDLVPINLKYTNSVGRYLISEFNK